MELVFPVAAQNKRRNWTWGEQDQLPALLSFSLCTANATFLLCCALVCSCPLPRHGAPFRSSIWTENVQNTL